MKKMLLLTTIIISFNYVFNLHSLDQNNKNMKNIDFHFNSTYC
jgi:hypothetical protein